MILTDTELSGLKTELPDKWEYYLDRLSCHIASTGKQYHSHAATIYKWAQEDAAKGKAAPKQGIPDYSCKEGESLCKNEIEAMITDITTTTTEAEDYTGEDGLLYCGKCHTPKEAYFAEGKTCFGRDRHPTDCDCQRAAREKQQAAESRQKHLEKWRT